VCSCHAAVSLSLSSCTAHRMLVLQASLLMPVLCCTLQLFDPDAIHNQAERSACITYDFTSTAEVSTDSKCMVGSRSVVLVPKCRSEHRPAIN